MNIDPVVVSMSPQPLYLQLKELLRGYIMDGTYAPHSKLPSENELIKQYKVSRITVRQALRDLQKEGLIFSIQGKGSFVTKPKAIQDLTRLQGFGEAMSRHGLETYSKVLSIKRLPADKHVATALNLEKGHEVFEFKRIRFLNRAPVSLDISYFDISIGDRQGDGPPLGHGFRLSKIFLSLKSLKSWKTTSGSFSNPRI